MTTPRWLLVPILATALALASCSTASSGTASPSSGAGGLSQGILDDGANQAWGEVGSMGEGRPDFPDSRDGYSLTVEWDSQSRAFEDTVTLIGSHTGMSQFTPTMNGCNKTDYLIRWRTVAEGVTVTAYSVDTLGDTHGEVTGKNGWLRLDGCYVPGFEFDSSDDGISNLGDVTVTVQAWRPSA